MDAQHRRVFDLDYVHHRRALDPALPSVTDAPGWGQQASLRPRSGQAACVSRGDGTEHLRAPGLVAALLAALVLGCGAASAQETLSVEVTPLRVDLRLAAGASHTQAVTLKNDGPKAVRIRARVDDWHLALDGTPQFKLASPGEPYSAAAWVRLNPPEQVLNPGAAGIVRFTTTVPPGARDAGYRCAVMFEFEKPDADPTAKNREVMFRGRVATVLYVTVGAPPAAVELTDLESRVLPNRPAEVVATLHNTGPVHTRTRGTAIVYDAAGTVVRRLAVPDAPVLPESVRQVAIPTAGEGQPPLSPGTYRVELKLDLGLRELLVGETSMEIPRG